MSESDPHQDSEPPDPPDPNQDSMFGDAPSGSKSGIVPTYQVLARKYRPSNFSDLIGQEPMVHTLTNAFASARIAHAFMLTGVRGVGKTTTARLLARALNYQSDKVDGPSMQLDPPGVHCAEISASRHMDVMEMDAASHTGIADIREILDGVRYAPVSARYKVYIIDEVHMLSKQAFNALLKTLEEPPPHAIFILATTEIRKVPVTILSRCQRFDLSRVDPPAMAKHLANICTLERREVSEQGLHLIAKASEGSVRDALSILDQALVQADDGASVSPEEIRIMLGLADRTRVLGLLALVMKSDAPAALIELRQQYDLGADPLVIFNDLLDHCHQITRTRALGDAADLTEYGPGADQVRGLASDLSMGQLSRTWQMLLKATSEIRIAPDPLAAAEMALIRLCVASDLPSPEAAAKLLVGGAEGQAAPASKPAPSTKGAPSASSAAQVREPVASQTAQSAPNDGPRMQVQGNLEMVTSPQMVVAPEEQPEERPETDQNRFEDLLAFLEDKREVEVLSQLERYVRLVSYQPGAITFAPEGQVPEKLPAELSGQLQNITGRRWLINMDSRAQGADTIAQVRKRANEQDRKNVLADPSVQAILEVFPKAKIIRVFDPRTDGPQDEDTL